MSKLDQKIQKETTSAIVLSAPKLAKSRPAMLYQADAAAGIPFWPVDWSNLIGISARTKKHFTRTKSDSQFLAAVAPPAAALIIDQLNRKRERVSERETRCGDRLPVAFECKFKPPARERVSEQEGQCGRVRQHQRRRRWIISRCQRRIGAKLEAICGTIRLIGPTSMDACALVGWEQVRIVRGRSLEVKFVTASA
jgi:hypothetical protein